MSMPTMNWVPSTSTLPGGKISPPRIISAIMWAAVPSLAYFEDGRVRPSARVIDAGHDIHIAALEGLQAACWFISGSAFSRLPAAGPYRDQAAAPQTCRAGRGR